MIEQKMAQLLTKYIGAYLRKMAIDGYIIYTDLSEFKDFQKELQAPFMMRILRKSKKCGSI